MNAESKLLPGLNTSMPLAIQAEHNANISLCTKENTWSIDWQIHKCQWRTYYSTDGSSQCFLGCLIWLICVPQMGSITRQIGHFKELIKKYNMSNLGSRVWCLNRTFPKIFCLNGHHISGCGIQGPSRDMWIMYYYLPYLLEHFLLCSNLADLVTSNKYGPS